MIDSKAVVADRAQLGSDVKVDAFAVIEDDVSIGSGSWVGANSIIKSGTRIGENNHIHEFVSLGGTPQSTHYKGEPTELVIGDGNIFREYASLHRGTVDGGGVTRVGNDNFLMAYTHIAHDCQIGNSTIFTNGTNIAGHVEVEDFAFFGGFTLIHQRCRIGTFCMTGINTILRQDVPPYVTVTGSPAKAVSINAIGLRRRGVDESAIKELKRIYRWIFREGMSISKVSDRIQAGEMVSAEVKRLISFIVESERGFVR